MRPLLLALPFFAMIAFAQSPDSKLTQGADSPPQDAAAKARTRAEGSAGGTGEPLSDEAKKGVGAGAGPHRHAPTVDYKRRTHSGKQSDRQGDDAASRK
jgi:hypothetical protein